MYGRGLLLCQSIEARHFGTFISNTPNLVTQCNVCGVVHLVLRMRPLSTVCGMIPRIYSTILLGKQYNLSVMMHPIKNTFFLTDCDVILNVTVEVERREMRRHRINSNKLDRAK